MAAEVWFRNPKLYIRECVELGEYNLAWDRGYLRSRNVDPTRYVELYVPAHADYRQLVIGDQGAAELRRGYTLRNPFAVYPTWCYDIDHFTTLEELMARPAQPTPGLPVDENPVKGQEHRIVVSSLPLAGSAPGRQFYRDLRELHGEYPDCKLHLHGSYSFGVMFGMGWNAVDVDARSPAHEGKVVLPSGATRTAAEAARSLQWVHLLGYSAVELRIPRVRCMFNMKSARWAAAFYNENYRFRTRGRFAVDPDSINHARPLSSRLRTAGIPVTVGDRLHCDPCSLNAVCKYFRDGGVCSIPGTETAALTKLFGSRDADQVIDGLGAMVQKMVDRAQKGLEAEDADGPTRGVLDPEVTKALGGAFASGVTLAKLLDPGRFSLTKPAPAGQGAQHVELEPAALVAEAVRALEAQGIKREDMTPRMFEKILSPYIAKAIPAADVIDVVGSEVT